MKTFLSHLIGLTVCTPVLFAQTNVEPAFAPVAIEPPAPSAAYAGAAPAPAWPDDERPPSMRRDADDEFEGALELQGSYGWALNGDYLAISRVSLRAPFIESSKDWGGLVVGGGVLELRNGTFAQFVARDPLVLEIGLFYRHYFTEPHVFLRPYAGFSWTGLVLIWDYRMPVDTGYRVLHMDYMYGTDVGASIGLAVQLSQRCNVFGEAIAGGVILPEDTTRRGVYNDFFESFGYAGARVGLLCKF